MLAITPLTVYAQTWSYNDLYKYNLVHVGDVVTFTNTDNFPHSVQGTDRNGEVVTSGIIAPNQKIQMQFTTIGQFEFFDNSNQNNNGMIEVINSVNDLLKSNLGDGKNINGWALKASPTFSFPNDAQVNTQTTSISDMSLTIPQSELTRADSVRSAISLPPLESIAHLTIHINNNVIVAPLDTTSPVITPPPNQVVMATNSQGAVVSYPVPTATDNVGITRGPTCTPASGSTFPIGITTVTCTASDVAGNVGQTIFTVTVQNPSTPQPSLSVKTDLNAYHQEDTIVITGHVNNMQSGTVITLRVFNQLSNLISLSSLSPSSDGSFTTNFLATGPLWKNAGTYTIVAQYGKYAQENTTFNYYGQTSTSSTTTSSHSSSSLPSTSTPSAPTSTPTASTPTVPTTISPSTTTPSKIPNWVKGIFSFYAEGKLSDDDLIKALQFLIQQGIIKV